MARRSPYDLVCDPHKTTLTCPGGVVLGYGPGPGLRSGIFWNRIGSLFSCYRPAVAVLTLFSAQDLHHPVALKPQRTRWEPNLCTATYTTPGLRITEERTALTAGLRAQLNLTSTSKKPREWVLFFHGQVQQWEFFDYKPRQPAPAVACSVEPKRRIITLAQPHPHDGLQVVNSVQTVTVNRTLASHGFGLSEGDLSALWHDHGCLASLKLRLGQVGGRLIADEQAEFSHRHPLYYFAVRLKLTPGQRQIISVGTQYRTDDPGGELPNALEGTTHKEWQRYLGEEVPQLACDDEELTRYWYYVWYVLRANRTAPGKHVTYPYTAPSKYLYWGPWIWDCYFHVLGEMWLQDPEVARNSIRAVLDTQFPNGYIPVCSGSQYRMCFHDSVSGYETPGGGGRASYVPSKIKGYRELAHPYEAEFEYRTGRGGRGARGAKMLHNEKTQTPLISAAAQEYVATRDDPAFAGEVLPRLLEYDDWLWRRRTDSKGRFVLWHGDESGWDNATRHYPVPAKPFDVQVHALMHRHALRGLEACVRDETRRRGIAERIGATRESLKSYWDENDCWHYDFAATAEGRRTGKRRKQIAASGLFALLVEQSRRTVEACLFALGHGMVFSAEHPVPTLAMCDPDYAPHGWGWNGPVWLQVNYFTIVGLLQAKEFAAAFELWEKTRRLIIRDGRPCSFELYDPETGTGMGCPDYSWQAMVNHLIIRYFAGVRSDGALNPALPPGMKRLAISQLPGAIRTVSLTRSRKRVLIDLEFGDLQQHREEALKDQRPGTDGFSCLKPVLCLEGLGDVSAVSGNGVGFAKNDSGAWGPPVEAEPSRTWEIIATCR